MSSENEEDSNDESTYDPNGEGINDDNLARSQQQSPLSIQSNTSLDGTTSSHSSDEEDQTDQR
jgi:hypothetical protein